MIIWKCYIQSNKKSRTFEARTRLSLDEIISPTTQISHQSIVGLIGSCFVENIGAKLAYFKFKNWINPNGILFHPLAIEKALSAIISNQTYSKSDLLYHQERWHSLDYHSDFSSPNSSETLEKINKSIQDTHTLLIGTSHLVITLGTAWVYHHIASDRLVANCHKIPQKEFIKRLLSMEEIVNSLTRIVSLVKRVNPTIEILFTLSPIRHLRDGMLANSQSKSLLLSAIHQVIKDNDIRYFPSYEIMLDDLRDYRFYKADLLHPNETGIQYIWNIFKEVWITPTSYNIMKQIEQVQKGLQHKSFNANSNDHLKFLKHLEQKKETLYTKYGISF